MRSALAFAALLLLPAVAAGAGPHASRRTHPSPRCRPSPAKACRSTTAISSRVRPHGSSSHPRPPLCRCEAVGTHSAGPTWRWKDGSAITGKLLISSPHPTAHRFRGCSSRHRPRSTALRMACSPMSPTSAAPTPTAACPRPPATHGTSARSRVSPMPRSTPSTKRRNAQERATKLRAGCRSAPEEDFWISLTVWSRAARAPACSIAGIVQTEQAQHSTNQCKEQIISNLYSYID